MKLLKSISLFIGGTIATTNMALAKLPDIEKPSKETTGIISTFRNYGYDFVILAGLAIAAIAFIVVCKNLIATYGEVQSKKATWGELGAHAIAGILVLAIVVYLLTQASTIMSS